MANYSVNTRTYFEAFNQKNIELLSTLYSDDVRLTDWLINVQTKEDVLSANEEFFKNDFVLTLKSLHQVNNITFNEITIEVGGEVINIMDVITFNEKLEIENITAYKR